MLSAGLFVDRQEAFKAPASGRQTGCRQRADRRTAARNRDNGYIVLGAQRDQILTRIGNRRRARIGYERTGLTGEQLLQNCFTACAAIVFVVRDHRLFGQFAGVKQLLRHAGVRGDKSLRLPIGVATKYNVDNSIPPEFLKWRMDNGK